MKKLLGIIFMLFVGFALVACEVVEDKFTPEDEIEDVIPEEDNDVNPEEDKEPEIDEEDKEPEIDEEDKEPEIDEEDEDLDGFLTVREKETILIDQLRTKDKSITVIFTEELLKDFLELRLEMSMGGSYDNPLTIKRINVNGEDLNLRIDELPTAASGQKSGDFLLDGHEVTLHRATNYQPLRIKSKSSESGYLILSLDDINELEIELVFTTTAADYFEEVVLTLN